MMTTFWICITVLTLLALSFIVAPLLRQRSRYIRVIAFTVFAIPAFAFSTYLYLGNSDGLQKLYLTKQHQAIINKAMAEFANPQEVIDKMKQRLAQEPKSYKGWYLLGRVYESLGKYKQAADALKQANTLKPHDERISIEYAQALFFVHKRELNREAKELVEDVLTRYPEHPIAINLLALDSYSRRNYELAIQYWEKLLPHYSAESEDGKTLLRAINDAQKKLVKSPTKATLATLNVQVNIVKELRSQLKPDDVVYIYAKASNGPPMPLAIVRKQVSDLPLTVILNDAKAMTPSMRLSKFPQVKVFARVSKSGNAIAAKGDLLGESHVIELSKAPKLLEIKINHPLL